MAALDETRRAITDLKTITNKRKRQGIIGGPQNFTTEDRSHVLDCLVRWNVFLYNSVKETWQETFAKVYGRDGDVNSWEAAVLHMRALEEGDDYKHNVLKRMESHVRRLLLAPEYQRLHLCQTKEAIAAFFTEIFNSHNFLYVWYFMDGLVDYGGSSKLACYVNLATAVKICLDDGMSTYARQRLVRFYELLPLHPNFGHVNRRDFPECNRDKIRCIGPNENILDEGFVSLGPSPKKDEPSDGHHD